MLFKYQTQYMNHCLNDLTFKHFINKGLILIKS